MGVKMSLPSNAERFSKPRLSSASPRQQSLPSSRPKEKPNVYLLPAAGGNRLIRFITTDGKAAPPELVEQVLPKIKTLDSHFPPGKMVTVTLTVEGPTEAQSSELQKARSKRDLDGVMQAKHDGSTLSTLTNDVEEGHSVETSDNVLTGLSQSQVKVLKAEIQVLKKKNSTLQTRNDALEAMNQQYKAQVQQKRLDANRATEQKEIVMKGNETLMAKCENLNTFLKEKEESEAQQLQNYQNEVEKLNVDLDKKKKELDESESKVIVLETLKARLENEVETLKRRIENEKDIESAVGEEMEPPRPKRSRKEKDGVGVYFPPLRLMVDIKREDRTDENPQLFQSTNMDDVASSHIKEETGNDRLDL